MYATKWLPVEGEIKNGDIIDTSFGYIKFIEDLKTGFYDCIMPKNGGRVTVNIKNAVKVKLFLISNNIQVGDEVTTHETGEKRIGQISSDALSYVKEGMEYEEDQVKRVNVSHRPPQHYKDYHYYKIKGPCGHFH